MRAKTKLAQTLGAGKWAITAECLPPRGADPSAVKKLAACFSPALDAVVVADNHRTHALDGHSRSQSGGARI
jgi:methylenetetrahydrofolate reductase (NADPH)